MECAMPVELVDQPTCVDTPASEGVISTNASFPTTMDHRATIEILKEIFPWWFTRQSGRKDRT
jgi:hypothetical protein